MFAVVVAGRPCAMAQNILAAEGVPSGDWFVNFNASPRFSHITVFLLPGEELPEGYVGAVYLQYVDPNRARDPSAPPNQRSPDFRFLGAIANEKPSAIFKVDHVPFHREADRPAAQGEVEMTDVAGPSGGAVDALLTIGISIEQAGLVAPRLTVLTTPSTSISEMIMRTGNGLSPPRHGQQQLQQPVPTKVLAQRIIGNAFNFLASFAASDPSRQGEEVVPLKSFRDWWAKFERRVENDPGFLERDENAA